MHVLNLCMHSSKQQGTEGRPPFGPSTALFAVQCETIEAALQDLSVTRAQCLDYFGSLNIPDQNHIWSWEKDEVSLCYCGDSLIPVQYKMYPERSAVQFASLIGAPLCCPANNSSITGSFSQYVVLF